MRADQLTIAFNREFERNVETEKDVPPWFKGMQEIRKVWPAPCGAPPNPSRNRWAGAAQSARVKAVEIFHEGGAKMNKKASEIMGEAVIAGTTLEAKKSVIKSVAFGLGGLVGEALAGVAVKDASLPGDHEGIFYVAVGPTNIGFFAIKRGWFKNSLEKLLVQHSRSELQAMEIEGGAMPKAHFVFQDGTHYALVCPRIHLGKLKKVREELVPQ